MANQEVHNAFVRDLSLLYDSEFKFQEAAERMAELTHSSALENLLDELEHEAREQIHRLVIAFDLIKAEPDRLDSLGATGLIAEAKEASRTATSEHLRDYALATSVVKFMNYQIALYKNLMTAASFLDYIKPLDLFHGTLQQKDANLRQAEGMAAEALQMALRPKPRTAFR